MPYRGRIRAAERQRFFDSFSEPIPAVPLAQPEQLDHRPRARLWAVPFPQALPQTVEAFRPAPAFAPLLQRTRSCQCARLALQHVKIVLQIEHLFVAGGTTLVSRHALSRRIAELRLKAPVRAEGNEPLSLLPLIPAQNLLHRTLQVVVAQPPKHPAEELKRELVCFQKRLLGGVIVGAMKRSASRHRAHREAIHLAQLAHDFRESFVPINLCLAAPVVALRHERLPFCHPQLLLATADVMTHGRFRHCNLGPFRTNPLPDAVRRMPLLTRSLLVSPQNLVDELFHRFELGLRPHRNLALRRDRARHRLPHDPPMHPELLRHALDRSYPKAVLPPDLFKQFHLASPVHRPPRPGWQGQGRTIYRYISGGAKLDGQSGAR